MKIRIPRIEFALVAVLGMSMVGCVTPDSGSGDSASGIVISNADSSGDTSGTVSSNDVIAISSLSLVNATENSFDAAVNYSDDANNNASVSLNYCNQTDLPGCDPSNGSSIWMDEVSGRYMAQVSGLSSPNDPGDVIKVKVTAYDPDSGTPSELSNIVVLQSQASAANDGITIANLTSTTSVDSISASIGFSGDDNGNASVALHYCNQTSQPGCDPISGNSVSMVKSGSNFTATINNLSSPGDTYNLEVSVADTDGVNASNLVDTATLYTGGAVVSGLACGTSITSSGTYVLDQNLVCSGSWLSVSASNVVVNMSGHSITYSNSTSGAHAIELNGSVTGFKLGGNGTINSGSSAGHAIFTNNDNINGLDIGTITFNMRGPSADAIHFSNSPSAVMDIAIHDNVMNMNPVSAGYVTGVYFDGGGSGYYTGSINNNAITLGQNASSGRPSAIAVTFPNALQNNPLEIHSNTITLNGTMNNGVRLYGSDNFVIRNNSITVTSVGNNAKPIQLDGGSSYNDVYANNIDVNSTDTASSTYAIRIRFDASYNKIHANTINIEDSSGSYPAYGIVLGATEGGTTPNANEIYDNLIVGADGNIPLAFYEDSGYQASNDYHDNTVINTGNGPLITFYPVYTSRPVYNLRFANESYSTNGSTVALIPSFAGDGSLKNVSWCGSNITNSEVNDVNGIGGWSISNSACTL